MVHEQHHIGVQEQHEHRARAQGRDEERLQDLSRATYAAVPSTRESAPAAANAENAEGRTHAAAQKPIAQFASIRGVPHPLMSARFVSGVPESASRTQYPTWSAPTPAAYAATIDGRGEIADGCSSEILAVFSGTRTCERTYVRVRMCTCVRTDSRRQR